MDIIDFDRLDEAQRAEASHKPVGLLPDANGFGRPDIFMAKRVAMRRTD